MTEQVFTRRYTTGERETFIRRNRQTSPGNNSEPALGSVSERLDILIRRFGGRTRVVLTAAERAQLEQCRVTE